MLCLIGDTAGDAVLSALKTRLDQAAPHKVPFAAVNATEAIGQCARRWADTGRGTPLLPLLDELRDVLMADRFGRNALGRFRHYDLADWLTGQRLPPDRSRNTRAITGVLQHWYDESDNPAASPGTLETVAESIWMKVGIALLIAWHRPLRFRLWVRRVPLVGREPRWLMRQPFMVPGHSTRFTGFAERLTEGRRDKENLVQLKKLLVHAFLRDLRTAYRPRGLRPARWRRTAYVVVLLDGISEENGGWELLRLINDVRNESAEHDPLLVVAAAEEKPPCLSDERRIRPVSQIRAELDDWYRELPARRQLLQPDARFLVSKLPAQEEIGTNPPTDADESAWSTLGAVHPHKPPPLTRKPVIAAALIAVLLATVLTGGRWLEVRWSNECLPNTAAGVAVQWLDKQRECVGYSDDTTHVFGTDPRLRAGQLAVFEHNALAKQLHAENPRRPLVSVVYFADLSHPIASPGSDASTSEELEGLLIRQRQQNRKDLTEPLLRVIVANGGDKMAAARIVVDDLLGPLIRDDGTVLGVIGMALTVDATESAVGALGDLGVPVVATTLTGEALPRRSPIYFQLVPGNDVQAELVAEYSRYLDKSVTVYHPPLSDNYLRSLVENLAAALGEDGAARQWGRQVGEVDIVCGRDTIAFYAGRENDFPGFLREVVNRCKNERPVIIGDDTVTRFVAQSNERLRDEFNNVTISYVSLGSRIVLAGRSCRTESSPGGKTESQFLNTFCAGHRGIREATTGNSATADFARRLAESGDYLPWPGERIGLAYDAGGLFIDAVRRNQNRMRVASPGTVTPSETTDYRPHRATIAQELREPSAFEGASGPFTFDKSRTAVARPLAILTIDNIHDLDEVPTCSYEISMQIDNRPSRPWGTAQC